MKPLIAAALTLTLATAAHAGAPGVVVEKSATCGCCTGWVDLRWSRKIGQAVKVYSTG